MPTVASLRVGLAVLDALTDVGARPMMKWPNDILVDGRKVAGILCESRWRNQELLWIAAGIGINVFGPVSEAVSDRAIALDEVVPGVERLHVLEEVARRLRDLPDHPALTDQESNHLRTHDWLSNRKIATPVIGTACGVAQNGALQVRTDEGTVDVFGGEVVIA